MSLVKLRTKTIIQIRVNNRIVQQQVILVINAQVESINMMVPETQNNAHITSFTIPETQKSPELTSAIFREAPKIPDPSLEVPHTTKRPLKPTEHNTKHNSTSFQNIFMKELEAIKDFTKSAERNFEELEKAIKGLSEPKVSNCTESSSVTVELLKNRVSTLEKLLIEKYAIINLLLKQNKENHESFLTQIRLRSNDRFLNSCNNPLRRKISLQLKKENQRETLC